MDSVIFKTALLIWGAIGIAACFATLIYIHYLRRGQKSKEQLAAKEKKIAIIFLSAFLGYNILFMLVMSGVLAYMEHGKQPYLIYIAGLLILVYPVLSVIDTLRNLK